jgi:hypothetical protein
MLKKISHFIIPPSNTNAPQWAMRVLVESSSPGGPHRLTGQHLADTLPKQKTISPVWPRDDNNPSNEIETLQR